LAKFQQRETKKAEQQAGSVDLATGKEKSNRRQALKERVQNLTSLHTKFTRPE
jgi:hypothetical protein